MQRNGNRVAQSGGLVWLSIALHYSGIVHAQSKVQKWEKFDFARQPIQLKQIEGLSLLELKYLRGIVFGRHGRVFGEQAIQKYLRTRPWYKPNPKFHVSVLNAIERRNMDLIKEAEWKKHTTLQPGDLRFYRNRLISKDQLGHYKLAELRIMRAEIEALHGKRFSDEPWLQTFFEQRYWYKPDAKYHPGKLSPIEHKNIALLASVEKRQRHLKLALGGMKAFQNQFISETMLHGLSLYELRLLRNEIYALRGQQFRTPWIQNYFSSQVWYSALPDFREPTLSAFEKRNY